MNIFEEVKSRINLSQVFKKFGYPVDYKSGKALCPFHGDTNPSCSVSNEKGVYHCFSCEESGSVIDLYLHFFPECNGNSRKAAEMAYKDFLGEYKGNINTVPPVQRRQENNIVKKEKRDKANYIFKDSSVFAKTRTSEDEADPLGWYLTNRGIPLSDFERLQVTENIRWHRGLFNYKEQKKYPAAVLGAYTVYDLEGEEKLLLSGIMQIFIKDGYRIQGDAGKLAMGGIKSSFCPVWNGIKDGEALPIMSDSVGHSLIVCEGFEDALCLAKAMPEKRIVCANGLTSLASMRFPKAWQVKDIIIYGDLPRLDITDKALQYQSTIYRKAIANFQKQGISVFYACSNNGKDANEEIIK